MSIILKMNQITKSFPGVLANDHINFEVRKGEVHALLGQNGAGKTTLMNILYGYYQRDGGEIFIRGKRTDLKSPRDAINLGIGMVHQHFMLVPTFTVIENIVLGLKSSREPLLDTEKAEKRVLELSRKHNLKVDPHARIFQLSVGEQQRVEILKTLYRGAEILILDEPTSVLTPQEGAELFKTLRSMVERGYSVIFISHKLHEVMEVSNRITVLRHGKKISTVETKNTNVTNLAKMVIGREPPERLTKKTKPKDEVILEVQGLWAKGDRGLDAVKDVSFSIRKGEILGVAGVAGNGQHELSEAVTGLRKAERGRVTVDGEDLTNQLPGKFIERGVGYIPGERRMVGSILGFSIAENLILKSHDTLGHRGLLDWKQIEQIAKELIVDYDIVCTGPSALAEHLSGGNLQRLILAREISREPKLLVACNSTGGLDFGATRYIQSKLIEQRDKGTAILMISEDLDEIISLSDRIAVMYEGEIVDIVPADEADIKRIGLMMTTGSKDG